MLVQGSARLSKEVLRKEVEAKIKSLHIAAGAIEDDAIIIKGLEHLGALRVTKTGPAASLKFSWIDTHIVDLVLS